jgi:hypothetical protein
MALAFDCLWWRPHVGYHHNDMSAYGRKRSYLKTIQGSGSILWQLTLMKTMQNSSRTTLTTSEGDTSNNLRTSHQLNPLLKVYQHPTSPRWGQNLQHMNSWRTNHIQNHPAQSRSEQAPHIQSIHHQRMVIAFHVSIHVTCIFFLILIKYIPCLHRWSESRSILDL